MPLKIDGGLPAPTDETTFRARLFSIDEKNSCAAPDALTVVALIYIAIPTLIFLAGFLRWWASIPLIVLSLVNITQFCRRADIVWKQPYTTAAFFIITVIAFAWASLGGAGHFFSVNPDWLIRDKVLGDLTLTDWPPAYSFVDGQAHLLRTAFGFFLPAALVGKIFGIGVVDIALYLYCAMGCSLFLLLLPQPRKSSWLLVATLLVSIFFSGMDYLGIVLATGITPLFPLRLSWWVSYSYSSFDGAMRWAPNHAIPLFLVTTLFYRHWGTRSWPALFMVLLPLTVIWTPFAVAAILPFLIFASWRWFATGNTWSQAQISPLQILCTLVLSIITIRFITLDFAHVAAMKLSSARDSIKFDSIGPVYEYLLFVLMEFAILALLLWRGMAHSHGLFVLSCFILCILPFATFGPSNDLLLRLSVPSLIVILICTLTQIKSWVHYTPKTLTPYLIVLVLVGGVPTVFFDIWRAIAFNRTVPNYSRSLVEQHWDTEPPHYVGVANSAWLNAVLSAPTRVPTAEERKQLGR